MQLFHRKSLLNLAIEITKLERVLKYICLISREKVIAMRQLPADKYNVAWFKLAEFVARGEKERALGMYRLLVHSFNDKALAYQLEGDILLSFKDTAAIEKYNAAALLYQKEQRLIEAAAIYEHIVTLLPNSEHYLNILIELYEVIPNDLRLVDVITTTTHMYVKNNDFEKSVSLLEKFEPKLGLKKLVSLYQTAALAMAQHRTIVNQITVQIVLEKTIKGLIEHADEKNLQNFLVMLKAIDESMYEQAYSYV